MKKFWAVLLLAFTFTAHAQVSKETRSMVSQACSSAKPVIDVIIKNRDEGAPMSVILKSINQVLPGAGDDDGAVELTKQLAVQATKDAYSNRKLDSNAVFFRYYDRCMRHFGITDSTL